MTSWEREQQEYRERKIRDGEEMAWLLAVCIFAASVIAAVNVAFDAWIRPLL